MDAQSLNFKISGNTLVISKGRETNKIKFQFNIKQVEEFDDCCVVRLNVPRGTTLNENVFGVSGNGNIAWQIEKLKYVYRDSPFTNMSRDDDHIKLFNWDGTDLLVNPKTGKIIRKGYSK